MAKKLTLNTAAVVTVHRAADMSPKGRKVIAAWLRKQAGYIETHAKELSPRFTARYLHP